MAKGNYCKYHAEIPARWYCSGCKITLCSHCVMEERQSGKVVVCPACDKALRKLSTAHAIPPFWKRMPQTFTYPFNGGSLTQLFGFSIFSLLLFAPLWPVVVVASLILPFIILRYGFSVMQHTAMGHLSPPKISLNFRLHELSLPLKMVAVMISLSLILGIITYPFGPQSIGAQGFSFVVSQLLLPAMLIQLAVYNSYLQAMNPVGIGFVISTLRLPYLTLCGVMLLLSGGPLAVIALFMGIIPLWMIGMFMVFVFGFFTVVTFHLMGYVVYQYHEQLGIKPEVEYNLKIKPSASNREGGGNPTSTSYPMLQKVRLLIKEGMQQAAKATLKQELQQHAELDNARIEMHQLYHQMLVNEQESDAMLEHGRRFIPALLDLQMGKQAIAIFRDCTEIDAKFGLTVPEDIHKLASAAQKADEHKVVVSLMNGFMQKHADYPDAIELLLMASQSLQHHFRQDEKAKKVLLYVIKRYPEDPRVQKAKRDLMLIERPAGATT